MKFTKAFAVVAALALALALAGCGSSAQSSSTSASDSSAASTSSSSQKAATVKWTEAKIAADAAKGAGFETFGVMKKVTIDGQKFKNPSFAYAGNVAQALYETKAIALDVRKADGKHEVALTDRDKTEFSNTWTKSYEGLDVTMYGPAKGAATVVTWADGTASYGVTYQGLGGEEVTMDSDEVAAIVKGIKEANTKKEKTEKKEEPAQVEEPVQEQQASDPSEGQLTITQEDATRAAEEASGGQAVSAYQDYIDGHGWVWVIGTNDENGNVNTYYVDNYGNPYNAEFDSNSSTEMTISEDEACAIAEDASGGKTTNAYAEETEAHGLCWHVTTEDENGNVNEYHVDNNGNAFNIEFE